MSSLSKAFAFCFCLLVVSCTYNTEEELYPLNTCDTDNISYSEEVVSILSNNSCISCHNATNPSGSVELDTYDDLKISVENGSLIGSIRHDDGFKAMPLGSTSKISDCEIEKLEAWIADGALNN